MSLRASRSLVALLLQVGALVVLALALLDGYWLDARARPRVAMLVDRSLSMPREATDAAIAVAAEDARSAGGIELERLEFAGKSGALSPESTVVPLSELEISATNIEKALEAALAAHAVKRLSGAVVISDGFETAGEAARALRAAREARLPVQWIAMGRPQPEASVADVLAPHRATAGQTIQLTVQLNRRTNRSLRVTATARDTSGDTQSAVATPDAAGRAALDFVASGKGALLVDVALEDAASGQRLDARFNAAAIDVTARAPVLYVQGSAGSLPESLLAGGWTLNVVPATRMDAQADRLAGYNAIVLDDVAILDAGGHFWNALVTAVKDRGVGLMVLGGERSFARGGYRGSTLESVLPVWSEPAALDQPASVMFAVDKSGSMGQGSGGVDRFRLAQRAVIETARGLSERDSLGLVVFDVEPRVLVPLGPVREGRAALERDWLAAPQGGTRLAPGLEAAIGELERSASARRMLVVVTDGFIDDAPLVELKARLARSRIETIALAVGPDADIAALERLIGPDDGAVLRVGEAAQLPQIMRSGIERRRARIERGTIAVRQAHPLPFAPGTLKDWPGIEAYAVTRSRAEATVAVQSERGDPLIAFQASGQGRVIVVTSGLGSWTPRWTAWREWPRLAGGLTDWIGGTLDDGVLSLAATDLRNGVQIEADIRGTSGWGDPAGVSVTAKTPVAEVRAVPVEAFSPGRLEARLPDDGPGLYTFVVASAQGKQRLLHLRRDRAEAEGWGTTPALQTWQREGLVGAWNPAAFASAPGEGDAHEVDRGLAGLALVLFLAGVLVDRRPLRNK